MNTTFAEQQATLYPCPPWCSGEHLPIVDGGRVHLSVEQEIAVNSSGEITRVFVSVERADFSPQRVGPADIRVEGLDSAPMTPAQAMQLAATLQSAAFAAVSLPVAGAR